MLVHMAYLVYAAIGGFLALRSLTWLWPHIASTAWSVAVTVTALNCPLTALEKSLLELAGRTPYDGSFTEHYLRGVLYPSQYEVAVWLGGIAVALLSYVVVLVRGRRPWPPHRGLHGRRNAHRGLRGVQAARDRSETSRAGAGGPHR